MITLRTVSLAALTLALSTPIIAQEAQESQVEIIVTGRSLKDTAQALQECLARGCPPEEDIRLTLEHAENQFVYGDYGDSRETIRDSLGRNRRHGDELPVPVSDLQRAQLRVAEHLGEGKEFQLATLDMRDTLEDGLGKDDWRTLAAEITVGDSRAKLGQPDDAERIYKRIEKRSVELGQPRVAMYARMRQALLLQARHESTGQDHWEEKMLALLNEIRDNPLKGGEEFAFVAEVMLAKRDRDAGDNSSTEALVQRFAEQGGAIRPVLLFSEPLFSKSDLDRESARASSASARLSTLTLNEPTWADIGFWINADGHVEDLEVLRSAGDTEWLKQVASHIDSRVYAPLKTAGSTPGFYMIERYTLTARYSDQTTGTRIRRREPNYRIERIDLTPDNYNQPVASES